MYKLVIIPLLFFVSNIAFGLTPEELLNKSDSILIPEVCTYNLSITTSNANGSVNLDVMTGYKKGWIKNVLIIVEPKRVAGSAHLRKGKVIWSYFTTNNKLMKMSYKAVFMNTLLNYGDVFSTELSADYDVVNIDESGDDYIINLRVKKGTEGYDKIIFTIDKKTYLPKKKEYYAVSGTLLKTSEFTKIDFENKKIEMKFYEPVKDRISIVVIDNIKILKDIPEKYYNENYIKFISGE